MTDLEFIRWRATVFGTDGHRILASARTHNFAAPNIESDALTASMPAISSKFCSNPS